MLWIRSNGQGVAYFPTFAGAQHAVQRKEHGGKKILPPSTDCVGFGFFLPSSSPSPVREKQQVEVHSLALLSPSDPMAWLSSALCSLGNPVEVIHDSCQPQLRLSAIPETCLHPSMLPLKALGRDIPDDLAFPWSTPIITIAKTTAAAPRGEKYQQGSKGLSCSFFSRWSVVTLVLKSWSPSLLGLQEPAAQDHWLGEKPGWWEFVCPGAGNLPAGPPKS